MNIFADYTIETILDNFGVRTLITNAFHSNNKLAIFVSLILITCVIVPLFTRTRANNQPQSLININSNNQQNGFTGIQNLNFGTAPRCLNNHLKSELLQKIKKNTQFHIMVKLDDEEAKKIAFEIKNFLIKNNFDCDGITGANIDGGDGAIYIQEDNTIMIGANIVTGRPIRSLSGVFVGLG